MLTDLLLAIAHHLLIFALIALLVTEIMLTRPGMKAATVRYLGWLDSAYGAVAGLILIVGFGRVFIGEKGPAFYLNNWIFWAKIAAFVIVGVLSLKPTLRIVQWRRAASGDSTFAPAAADVRSVRQLMHYEGMVLFTIPIFAALMARGYGL